MIPNVRACSEKYERIALTAEFSQKKICSSGIPAVFHIGEPGWIADGF